VDWNTPKVSKLIDNWIEEDLGNGDLTRFAITQEIGKAHWIAKEEGIFCGMDIIKKIFKKIDERIEVRLLIKDGEKFFKDQKILEINGPSRSLLACERICLNIAMHLSGISTYTYKLVSKLKNTKIKLADTRKTTPGLRIFEKYAFKCGGGTNHRMGLYDAAMIKENHIAWSKNLYDAIQKIRLNAPFTTHIIIEAENLMQAKDGLMAGADGLLLDEFEIKSLESSIHELRNLSMNLLNQERQKKLTIEVSGINPNEIENYLIDGIDYISTSSSITKSNWIDLSMRYY
tara:strand:- start:5002 stop:5865 length:864 start_codon:yes stop_codon:yes gene_type:complete